MFKQVHSGWPKAIWSIRNSVNPGPTIKTLCMQRSFGYLEVEDWEVLVEVVLVGAQVVTKAALHQERAVQIDALKV